jgi:hypothetical protein
MSDTQTEMMEVVPITNERGQTRNYETVASRLSRFRADHPDWAIHSEIWEITDEVVRARVSIGFYDAGALTFVVLSQAHAEEYRAASEINATSALENCETSALGRALAFIGYGSANSIASAEEVIGAKAKASTFAAAKPGALILLQNAAKVSYADLETCWKETLSAEDREACRPYITRLKREALEVVVKPVAEEAEEQLKEFGK